MKAKVKTIVLLAFFGLIIPNAQAQSNNEQAEIKYRHTIDVCPISPLFGIWAVHYTYRLTPKDELITGLSYMNIKFDGIGETNSPALILGYRRYLWKNLHFEYEIWPAYDNFWESNEQKHYPGFDLWNEFRLGYLFDVKVGNVPAFVNIQWPLGFGLYASNKPQSFKELEKDNRFFYFPPLIFVGLKF
ncbi:MAG: hypothetical protein RBT19_09915 [Tenuifilaceae bacterium]|jgi:hypothetical protein|nr:hypothetical protein [Tenuifilaceae bacterium]